MRKISDYIGNELLIFQKSIWKREFELRSGDEVIAQLYYPKFFTDSAELSIKNEIYEFYKPRFFSRDVDIRKKGYQNPIAQFKNNFWGSKGVLELPRGVRLNMKFGLFRKLAEIYLGESNLLISILSRFSLKEKREVIIEKRSEAVDEYPWIIMLAFCLSQLRKRNSAAMG
jgi:intein/homing endonuclease